MASACAGHVGHRKRGPCASVGRRSVVRGRKKNAAIVLDSTGIIASPYDHAITSPNRAMLAAGTGSCEHREPPPRPGGTDKNPTGGGAAGIGKRCSAPN